MTTLSERISWVLQHFNISQSELATLAGIKQPSVASWVSGKTKNMKSAPALAICSKLPLNQNWIVNGVGEPLVSNDQPPANQSNVEPIRGRMKRIPILSYVQAGDSTSTGQIAARQQSKAGISFGLTWTCPMIVTPSRLLGVRWNQISKRETSSLLIPLFIQCLVIL